MFFYVYKSSFYKYLFVGESLFKKKTLSSRFHWSKRNNSFSSVTNQRCNKQLLVLLFFHYPDTLINMLLLLVFDQELSAITLMEHQSSSALEPADVLRRSPKPAPYQHQSPSALEPADVLRRSPKPAPYQHQSPSALEPADVLRRSSKPAPYQH